MNVKRAILAGGLSWLIIFSVFAVMSFIPATRHSMVIQGVVGSLCIIPAALLAAFFYYKKSNPDNGFWIGIAMVSVALLLDLVVTVPLIEIPYNGSGYTQFLSNPVLWFLVVENVTVIYFYWLWKVKPTSKSIHQQ